MLWVYLPLFALVLGIFWKRTNQKKPTDPHDFIDFAINDGLRHARMLETNEAKKLTSEEIYQIASEDAIKVLHRANLSSPEVEETVKNQIKNQLLK